VSVGRARGAAGGGGPAPAPACPRPALLTGLRGEAVPARVFSPLPCEGDSRSGQETRVSRAGGAGRASRATASETSRSD